MNLQQEEGSKIEGEPYGDVFGIRYTAVSMEVLQRSLKQEAERHATQAPPYAKSFVSLADYDHVMGHLVEVEELSKLAEIKDVEDVTELCLMRFRRVQGAQRQYHLYVAQTPRQIKRFAEELDVFVQCKSGGWVMKLLQPAKIGDQIWMNHFPLAEIIDEETIEEVRYDIGPPKSRSRNQEFAGKIATDYSIFIRTAPNMVSTQRMYDALTNFKKGYFCSEAITNTILNGNRQAPIDGNRTRHRAVRVGQLPMPQSFPHKLNERQTEAVQFALQTDVTIIQGPPGTGKTCTAAAIVYAWTQSVENIILVCAGSNTAADNMCIAMGKIGLKPLRVFATTLENEVILPRAYDVSIDDYVIKRSFAEEFELNNKVIQYMQSEQYLSRFIPEQAAKLAEYARQVTRKPAANNNNFERLEEREYHRIYTQFINQWQIVVCTCSAAGGRNLLLKTFNCVLLDESSQCIEADQLIPITKGCQRLVLAGDTRQLGPVIKVQQMVKQGYGMTLMERMIKNGVPFVQLDEQYRMHPTLLEIPNQLFYGGAIRCGQNVRRGYELAERPNGKPLLQTKHKLLFIDVAGKEVQNGLTSSYSNQQEVDAALKLVGRIHETYAISYSDISVITFYSEQRKLLQKTFNDAQLTDVEINSVDGFQGREKKVIVISSVRTNNVGFVDDERRLNVALTRAQYQLYVLGSSSALQRSKIYQKVITLYKNKRVFVTAAAAFQESKALPRATLRTGVPPIGLTVGTETPYAIPAAKNGPSNAPTCVLAQRVPFGTKPGRPCVPASESQPSKRAALLPAPFNKSKVMAHSGAGQGQCFPAYAHPWGALPQTQQLALVVLLLKRLLRE